MLPSYYSTQHFWATHTIYSPTQPNTKTPPRTPLTPNFHTPFPLYHITALPSRPPSPSLFPIHELPAHSSRSPRRSNASRSVSPTSQPKRPSFFDVSAKHHAQNTLSHARNGRDNLTSYFSPYAPYIDSSPVTPTIFKSKSHPLSTLIPTPSPRRTTFSCNEPRSRSSSGSSTSSAGGGVASGYANLVALPLPHFLNHASPAAAINPSLPIFPSVGTPPNTPYRHPLPIPLSFPAPIHTFPFPTHSQPTLSHESHLQKIANDLPWLYPYASSHLSSTATYAQPSAPKGKKRCWVGRPVGKILRADQSDDVVRGLCARHRDQADFELQRRLAAERGEGEEWDGMRCWPLNVRDEDGVGDGED